MKSSLILFLILNSAVFAQEITPKKEGLYHPEYFSYTIDGLQPHEIRYSVPTKSPLEIFNLLVSGFESDVLSFPDEYIRIIKEVPGRSFVIKGTRKFVYCGDNFIGGFCLDAKYEINVRCEDSGYILQPVKLKRGLNSTNTVWGKIPLKGRANFYKKDGTLKKDCSNCAEATEDVLKRIALATLVFTRNIKVEVPN